MHKDLNTMFTDDEWFVIYVALASFRLGEYKEDFPTETAEIDAVIKKVHELIDKTDPAVEIIDLVLTFNKVNIMGEE